jgi:hypothetical protein
MEIFNKILERSKHNKELLGLWKYNDDDGFWCGYVIDYNETLVKIQHYTKGVCISCHVDLHKTIFVNHLY